jgi:hypothetical protein
MPPRNSELSTPERVVAVRKHGSGYQYEVQWSGSAETTWEAASRMKKDFPDMVAAFEQSQQPQQQQQPGGAPNAQDEMLAMRQQMASLMDTVRNQAQQLQQLRQSPNLSPRQLDGPSTQSRFARKEPRAQDLREYDGASGTKLDEWLQELSLATHLYQLNAVETSSFAVSRLRGAALQWWLSLDAAHKVTLGEPAALTAALRARFQPVTTARVAREQLDRLQQGQRHINEYIADFQRLATQIGLVSLGEENALFAFERGLRRDIAEKLRIYS